MIFATEACVAPLFMEYNISLFSLIMITLSSAKQIFKTFCSMPFSPDVQKYGMLENGYKVDGNQYPDVNKEKSSGLINFFS